MSEMALVQASDLQLAPAAQELGPPSRLPRGNRGPKASTACGAEITTNYLIISDFCSLLHELLIVDPMTDPKTHLTCIVKFSS